MVKTTTLLLWKLSQLVSRLRGESEANASDSYNSIGVPGLALSKADVAQLAKKNC